MPDVSNCRSCGANIIWLKHHRTGKAAPIDAEPVANGNIRIDPAKEEYQIIEDAQRETFAGTLRVNHFSTCPNAQKHKEKAK